MLPQQARLNLKKSYSWVRGGKKIEADIGRFYYRFGDISQVRIGVTSSSSVFNKAHDRNRARRLLSASLLNHFSELPSGLNLVALPSKIVLELSSEQISQKLTDVLAKISADSND